MKSDYDYLAAPLAALRAGETTRAIQQLEELRVVKPELVEVIYHLGRAWQAAGDNDKAIACYQEVMEDASHPYFAHARVRLAELGVDPDRASTGVVPDAVVEASHSEVVLKPLPEVAEAPAEQAQPEVEAAEPEAVASQEPAAEGEPEVATDAAQEPAPADAAAPKGKGKKSKAAAS